MAGTAFGLGAPFTTAVTPLTPWGLSPYGIQGQVISPAALQPLAGQSAYTQQPLQQIAQLLQTIPQQLQALQQLEYLQQQQIQQLLQIVPAQLAQLHQLVHAALQQMQQTQPLGQAAGAGGFVMTPWGITPQVFGAQPAQVM